jgi:hypothetical protein
VEWLLLAVPIAALVALFGPRRHERPGAGPPYWDGPSDGDDGAGVREPRRPGPHAGAAAVALAPPDGDG